MAAGPGSLTVFPVIGGAIATSATLWLPERGPAWAPAGLLLVATPVWFYSTGAGETTLALAASTLAFVAAIRAGETRADWTAGLLLGVSAVFRDEMLLLLPGLLVARYLRAGRAARPGTLLAAAAAPILAMAVVDGAWLDRPPLAHLRHAAPLLNAVLPRSRAVLPHLAGLGWAERYETIVEYWWLGGGPLVAVTTALGLTLAWLARRRPIGPWIVAAILAAAAAAQAVLLVRLVPAPRFEAGLLRLAPFLLLALLPAAPGAPRSTIRAVAIATTGCFLALTFMTLTTTGGKGLGPRLTVGLWPLLAAAAWEGFESWRRWPGPRAPRLAVCLSVLSLAAGSIVMEMGVALPAWVARSRQDRAALELVRHMPDRVIVIDDPITLQLVAPEFFRKDVLLVARSGDWPELGRRLAGAGVTRFTMVTRDPRPSTPIPPYHFAEHWDVSRYWIGRWRR